MCGCGCNSCGIGRLSLTIIPTFHRGMRGLGDVKAGSEFAVGFRYSGKVLDQIRGILPPSPEQIKDTVLGCVYGTGAFSQLTVEVNTGFATSYVTVKGTASTAFGNVEDIGGLIEGRIRECYPQFAYFLDSRDSVAIIKVPQDPTIPKAAVEIPAGTPGGLPAPVPSIADSLLSSLGLSTASSAGGSSLTKLIIPIGLAVLVAKAFK